MDLLYYEYIVNSMNILLIVCFHVCNFVFSPHIIKNHVINMRVYAKQYWNFLTYGLLLDISKLTK